MNADEQDRDDDGVPDDEPSTATTARHTLYAEECFRQLEYRQDAFGVSYPFEVQGKTLRLRKEYHVLQCLYLFLLYASRTRTFKGRRGITQEIADYFEIVGRDALSRLMAPSAEVIMFGPNSADRSTRFGTDLRQALPKLAEFMGIYMAPGWKPEDEAAQGDANIDLVGVQKLDNTKGGWNLFLAQCAAHEKHETWEKKRLEADLSYHNARFHSLVRAQAVLFVPTCFRQTSGDWVDKSAAANVILMDRLRIISAVNDDDPSVEGSCDFLQDKQLAGPFRGDRLSASA
ncbi:hypothetical protein [Allosphingosinicella sp.]|jgi:hypothetical protein|uniref:hypothetical protein n=1 Tax=Allosphingosinicella sp. TaxID=2823234 RepID=UPI002EFB1F57